MESALPQSSLNQCLGVIHKLISNVQPCRIAEKIEGVPLHFYFKTAKLKENKILIKPAQEFTVKDHVTFLRIVANFPQLSN